jgi:hypothetical protein
MKRSPYHPIGERVVVLLSLSRGNMKITSTNARLSVNLRSCIGGICSLVEILPPLSDMISVTTFALFFLRLRLFAYYNDFPARSGIRTRDNLISKSRHYHSAKLEQKMRLQKTAHFSRPWRVHELTKDFELEDVGIADAGWAGRPRATGTAIRQLRRGRQRAAGCPPRALRHPVEARKAVRLG